jgi:serine/threonine protein kinase HipA of HipAB toxin-antitoxin module
MKKPACVMSPKKRIAKIVGGGNYSEAEFSRVKRSLRRANKVGRMMPSQSHIIPLAMQKKLESRIRNTVAGHGFLPASQNVSGWMRSQKNWESFR